MSDTVIRVENLGKKYIIGHQKQESYTSLRDVITDKVKSFGSLINPKAKNENPAFEEFWALKDVSFEIKQGDRVGIIGRNGAGKSTLLKILSRITEPTQGNIKIKGRVASLLEVGTGFHPELTGRENIFLNGAILGMGKEEIKRKFDEIVAFAEVEKFLDTPVKRYSSGMYVRLAFAVAAHLEPEILIVDEVLAVGDAAFQKKCLGKMEDVGKEGRTVLFVSHNMSAIQSLCKRCIVFQSGHLALDSEPLAGVQFYLQGAKASSSFKRAIKNNKKPIIVSAEISLTDTYSISQVKIDAEVFSPSQILTSLDLHLKDRFGNPVGFGSLGALKSNELISLREGQNYISFMFSIDHLAVGSYFVGLDLTLPNVEYYDRVEDCLEFQVTRPSTHAGIRFLEQSWMYGSLEIGLNLSQLN
ncbi:polysaccharide ABC transporter ATP-binding protein [Nodularia harveyana UHCC-0300]|uniref:Polysaccharide ABC transporter ATP-binding protein n=1 Tax=Nodularia harveyana UHCC-0300 TaxID=2974287 RepID=A0ABU5UC69_9CYAN|nr:polysaccharide ABC transporter ATP-binding protein [Nodularia harveyana]MEA5581125.1 polysaccharide ABC transporter ATP-binding protein [Nodularia harveyana UHCC-0300]